MVGRCNYNHRGGQRVDLRQKRRYGALHLPCLLSVCPFLAYSLELVEEQNARSGGSVGEECLDASVRLA